MLNLNDLTPIDGYENIYWTHPTGHVWNGKKFLKPYKINSGYLCLKLQSMDDLGEQRPVFAHLSG